MATIGVQASSQHVLHSGQHPMAHTKPDGEFKVAVIGAGAAGTSAAFWLSRAKSRLHENITVTVYEKNNYIGGRSTTVFPYDDENLAPVELGASVYVDVNRNLVRAVKEFNLSIVDYGDENDETGIWDGQQFVLTMGSKGWRSWWETVKILWRYGYSPVKVRGFVKDLTNGILTLYQPHAPHPSIANLSPSLTFTALTATTTAKYLAERGVNPLFTHELIDAATRVNYGQNVDNIHALEGMVSLAANGAHSVAGGNWQVFERWIKESRAHVRLGTTVQRLRKDSKGKWHLSADNGSIEEIYDAIILGAPFKDTNIKLEAPDLDLDKAFPTVAYVHLHVTLLATTTSSPLGSYFYPTSPDTGVPQTVLTTSSGAIEPEFNSLTYHERIQRPGQPPEYVVKIFSKRRVEDDWLERMFGAGKVGWIRRKEWKAYPVLPPTKVYPEVKPVEGLYYLNAFEPFISTMETETISSLNAVDLLLHDQFGRGVCGHKEGDEYQAKSDDFVWGWDC